VVDEIELREHLERLLDLKTELGRTVAELVHLRRLGACEGGEDPAVQRSLLLAQPRQPRRPETLRRDPRARQRTLHHLDLPRLRAHGIVASGVR
jgi:hypothetical protein